MWPESVLLEVPLHWKENRHHHFYREFFFYVCALRLFDTSILNSTETHNKF